MKIAVAEKLLASLENDMVALKSQLLVSAGLSKEHFSSSLCSLQEKLEQKLSLQMKIEKAKILNVFDESKCIREAELLVESLLYKESLMYDIVESMYKAVLAGVAKPDSIDFTAYFSQSRKVREMVMEIDNKLQIMKYTIDVD